MSIVKEFVEKLIDRLEEEKEKGIYDSDSVISVKDAWRKSIKIVNQMAEEYVPDINAWKWIPCSERLPYDAFGCLVTIMDCEPMTQTEFENILPYDVGYDGETWNDADGNKIPFEVIAWMPLPEPYKQEQQKEIPTKHY